MSSSSRFGRRKKKKRYARVGGGDDEDGSSKGVSGVGGDANVISSGGTFRPDADDPLAPPSWRVRLRPLLGMSLIALSALVFSIMSLMVNISGKIIPAPQLTIVRSLVQGSLVALMMYRGGVSPVPPVGTRLPVFLRGFSGSVAATIFYYSISPSGANLSLAEGTVVFFTAPMWSAILARVWLREPFGRFDFGATLVAVSGVVLVAQPEALFGKHDDDAQGGDTDAVSYATGGDRVRGILICLLGSWIAAVAYVSIRSAGKSVNYLVLVFSFAVCGTLIPLFFMLVARIPFRAPEHAGGYFMVIGIGLCGFFGQLFLNKGMQLEKAGPGTTIRTLDVVFAFLFQVTVLGQVPTAWAILGATLISGCAVAMGIRRYYASRGGDGSGADPALSDIDLDDGDIETLDGIGALDATGISPGGGPGSGRDLELGHIESVDAPRPNAGDVEMGDAAGAMYLDERELANMVISSSSDGTGPPPAGFSGGIVDDLSTSTTETSISDL